MQCQVVLEMLSAYLDGFLSPDEHAAVEKHLANCNSCRLELEELRSCLNLLHDLPELSPPAGFRAGLMEKIDKLSTPTEMPAQKRWFDRVAKVTRQSWYRTAAVAAVMVMALGVTSLWEKDGHQFIPVTNQSPDVASVGQPNPEQQEPGVKEPATTPDTPVSGIEKQPVVKTEPNQSGAKPADQNPAKPVQVARNFNVESYHPQASEGLVDHRVVLKLAVQDRFVALQAVDAIIKAQNGSIIQPYDEATGKLSIRVPSEKSREVESQLKALGVVITHMPTDKDLSGQHKQAVATLDQLKEQKDQLENQLAENTPEVEEQLNAVAAKIEQQIRLLQQLEEQGKFAEIAITLE